MRRYIERSFAAARRAPVHDKNPALRAVEVMPVLPDFDRWHGRAVQVDSVKYRVETAYGFSA